MENKDKKDTPPNKPTTLSTIKKDPRGRPALEVTVQECKNALAITTGNIKRAAKLLNMKETSLYYRLDKFKLHTYVDDLRDRHIDQALDTIVDDLDNIETAKWYLTYVAKRKALAGGSALNIQDSDIKILVASTEQKNLLSTFIAASANNLLTANEPDDDDED